MPAEEEADIGLGEALAARTRALAAGNCTSLGPPDLCYCQKKYEASSGRAVAGSIVGGLLGSSSDTGAAGDSKPPQGFYHHVLGLDMSSTAAVATYVASLAAAQEPAGWLAAGSWSITSATYACWDAFGREELRIRVDTGWRARSIIRFDGRGGGETAVISAEFAAWRSALCCVLCALLPMRCLHVLPPLAPEQEPDFLESARALLQPILHLPPPRFSYPPRPACVDPSRSVRRGHTRRRHLPLL